MGDDELMRALAAGDRQALAQLYERHSGSVHAYARRILNREGEADDITQEVFIRIWNKASGYRPEAQFRAWAFRICLNLCRDHLRRKDATPIPALPATETRPGPGTPPDELACDRLLGATAREAVNQLAPEDRQILALRLDAGLSAAETADILGCSVRTVQYRTAHIIEALRKKLGALS